MANTGTKCGSSPRHVKLLFCTSACSRKLPNILPLVSATLLHNLPIRRHSTRSDVYLEMSPIKNLQTSTAWHWSPTGPSHTQGCVEVSESLGTQCWWHFDLYSIWLWIKNLTSQGNQGTDVDCHSLLDVSAVYSVWGNAKFVSPMYKHTPMLPFCYGTV